MAALKTVTFTGNLTSLCRQPPSRRLVEPLDPESSIALVALAQAGDVTARERLFKRFEEKLRIWAHGRLPLLARGPDDTYDLVQDTMLQVVGNLDSSETRHRARSSRTCGKPCASASPIASAARSAAAPSNRSNRRTRPNNRRRMRK
jgi:hypothetical protein